MTRLKDIIIMSIYYICMETEHDFKRSELEKLARITFFTIKNLFILCRMYAYVQRSPDSFVK